MFMSCFFLFSEMSEPKIKPPNRLRRPSYFHQLENINAIASTCGEEKVNGSKCPPPDKRNVSKCPTKVSGKVMEALMAQQQQGKLSNSALGNIFSI